MVYFLCPLNLYPLNLYPRTEEIQSISPDYSSICCSIRADAVSERLYRVFTAPRRLTLCTSEVRRSVPRMSDDTVSALLLPKWCIIWVRLIQGLHLFLLLPLWILYRHQERSLLQYAEFHGQ